LWVLADASATDEGEALGQAQTCEATLTDEDSRVNVKKRQCRLGEVDEIVLPLYAMSLAAGESAAHFAEIYGASVSKETISQITEKVIDEMNEWSARPLDEIYAAVFFLACDGLKGLPELVSNV